MKDFVLKHWGKLLLGAFAALLGIVSLAGIFVSLGFGRSAFATPPFIKEAAPFKIAMERLKGSPSATQSLGGLPVDDGAFFEGSIEESEKSGNARFRVDLLGPKGSGSLLAEAVKADGEWHFKILEFTPSSGGRAVNLLLEAAPKP